MAILVPGWSGGGPWLNLLKNCGGLYFFTLNKTVKKEEKNMIENDYVAPIFA